MYLLATELAKDDRFNVSFIVGDFGQKPVEHLEGVTIYRTLDIKKNFFLHSPKIWDALKQADADIYMSEACSLGTCLNAFFCNRKKKAFIYRTASSREANGTYLKQHFIRGLFVRRAFRSADVLITQNEQDQHALSTTAQLSSIVIRNACKINETQIPRNDTILWVGRSLPVKRPDLLLRLAEQLPEQQFVMICPQGAGDTQYPTLQETAAQSKNLTFLEHVPFHEIDRYFQEARLFVNTSDSEGFPNTFVQACKSGTPVLSLNVNPDNFLHQHQCGFCAEGHWEIFVQKVREWMQSDISETLGQNGQAYIKANHDLNVIIEQYKDIFRRQC